MSSSVSIDGRAVHRISASEAVAAVARLLGGPAPVPRPLSHRRPSADWREEARVAAKAAHLRATVAELTVGDAARSAEEHGPLLAAREGTGWVVVTGGSASAPRVLAGESLEGERACDPRELARELGARPDEPLAWIVLEPELPLDALRSEDRTLAPHQRLARLLREERGDLRAVVVYAVAIGALSLSVPIAVQALVNTIAFGSVVQPVVVLTLLVLGALLFDGALRILQASVVERLQQRIFAKAAIDVGERLARVRARVLRDAYAPELANRFFDVVTVQKAAAALLLDGVSLLLQTGVGLILLAFYHPWLLAFDVILLAIIAVILFGLGRGAVETAVKESKAKYAVVAWLEEIGRSTTLFRAEHARGYAMGRLGGAVGDYLTQRRKHWKIFLRQLVAIRVLFAGASAALLGVGGFLVIDRQLTLGQLVAAELIVSAVLAGLAKFAKHIESYYDLAAAADKLGQLVDLPLEEEHVSPAPTPPAAPGGARVEVRGEGGLTAHAGARLALVGSDDAQKSALLDAMYGLSTEDAGAVLADGRDLRQVDLTQYRSAVALVRSGQVFEGSIADNVRVGRDLDDATVAAALTAVGLWEELLDLPDGLETRLVAGGAPLTEMQARRLSIARAIAGRPRLLLVDHVLDGVEDRTRDRVLEALVDRRAPWTLVLATHRDDVAARCARPAPTPEPAASTEVPS